MKARVKETQSERATREAFEKNATEYANHVVHSVLALTAYMMYSKWKCSPETCRKRVADVADMLNAPQIFGKDINDSDYIDWRKNTLHLDVTQIKIKTKFDYV